MSSAASGTIKRRPPPPVPHRTPSRHICYPRIGWLAPAPFKPRRPEIGPNLAARLAIERCLPRAAARGHIASVRTNVATRPLKKRTGLKLLTPPLLVPVRRVPWFGTVCQDAHRPIEAFVAKTHTAFFALNTRKRLLILCAPLSPRRIVCGRNGLNISSDST